jgi:hypothetical protein
MEPGESLDLFAGKAFALEPRPGTGGIDSFKMAATVEFARQFKVMEYTKDSLDNAHKGPDTLLNRHVCFDPYSNEGLSAPIPIAKCVFAMIAVVSCQLLWNFRVTS